MNERSDPIRSDPIRSAFRLAALPTHRTHHVFRGTDRPIRANDNVAALRLRRSSNKTRQTHRQSVTLYTVVRISVAYPRERIARRSLPSIHPLTYRADAARLGETGNGGVGRLGGNLLSDHRNQRVCVSSQRHVTRVVVRVVEPNRAYPSDE